MTKLSASDLAISEPCHEAWDAMTPRPHGRHCDSCNMQVLDLSSMTADEADAQLAARRSEGTTCVRYGLDASGNIVFAAPRPALPAASIGPSSRRALPVVSSAKRLEKFAFAVPLLLAACTNHAAETHEGESCSTPSPSATTDALDRSWHVVGDDEVPPHVLGGGNTRPTDPLGTPDVPATVAPPVRRPPPPPQPPIVQHLMGEIASPPPPKMGRIAIPRR
jgi:hypothetical protein